MSTPTPESVGFSLPRLRHLDSFLKQRYVDTRSIPGFVAKIYREGELVHTSLCGHMDLERNKPMREDAIFRIYSMTKPIASVALMMLVEEGKIALDEPVHFHIPSWKNLGVYKSCIPSVIPNQPIRFLTTPVERPMKVIDLLTHTSGLTYGFMARTVVDATYRKAQVLDFQTPGGIQTLIEQLAHIPLEFTPGSAWNYSVSIDVIGYLIEKVSGMTLGDFLRQRIFEPLGMTDTDFHCPQSKLDRFMSCYQPKAGGGLSLQDDSQSSTFAAPPLLESGGGGLVSTPADYLRFCRMMLHGGSLDGAQILSPKTVELFSTNHLPNNRTVSEMDAGVLFNESIYAGAGFSLGCSVTIDLARRRIPGTLGEYSWGGAAATSFWIDPAEELTVVFMTQVLGLDSTRHNLRRDLRTLVYSAMTQSFA